MSRHSAPLSVAAAGSLVVAPGGEASTREVRDDVVIERRNVDYRYCVLFEETLDASRDNPRVMLIDCLDVIV
jgi:hypothetical protein